MVPTFDTSPWGAVDAAVPLGLPQTLHAQSVLLAYARFRGRLDGNDRWRFGLALHTAMLTDLYLTGHLIDEDNRPRSVDGALPRDPLLCAVLDDITDNEPTDWMNALTRDHRNALGIFHSELEAHGWPWVQRRRMLGILSCARST
jgi:hypothetical protein